MKSKDIFSCFRCYSVSALHSPVLPLPKGVPGEYRQVKPMLQKSIWDHFCRVTFLIVTLGIDTEGQWMHRVTINSGGEFGMWGFKVNAHESALSTQLYRREASGWRGFRVLLRLAGLVGMTGELSDAPKSPNPTSSTAGQLDQRGIGERSAVVLAQMQLKWIVVWTFEQQVPLNLRACNKQRSDTVGAPVSVLRLADFWLL